MLGGRGKRKPGKSANSKGNRTQIINRSNAILFLARKQVQDAVNYIKGAGNPV